MKRIPKHPTPPGEMLLEEFLKPLGVSQLAFSKHVGISFRRVNEIVKGHRGVTPDTAWRLAMAFGTSPQFWMNLQTNYDLAHRPVRRKIEQLTAVG